MRFFLSIMWGLLAGQGYCGIETAFGGSYAVLWIVILTMILGGTCEHVRTLDRLRRCKSGVGG